MGACMLSAALLVGGPIALAGADPDSSSTSSTSSTSATRSTSGDGRLGTSPSSGPRSGRDFGSSLRDSFRDIRSRIESLTDRRQPSRASSSSAVDESTESTSEIVDTVAEGADGDGVAPGTTVEIVSPEPAPAAPQPIVPLTVTTAKTAPLTASPPTAPAAGATTPAGTNSGRPPLPFDKVPDAVATVGGTVTTMLSSTHDTAAALPALLATLPTSRTPITDVITTLESMLTSMTDSVGALAALPGDLGALMGVPLTPVPDVAAPVQMARPTERLTAPVLADLMAAPPASDLPATPAAQAPVMPTLLSATSLAGVAPAAVSAPVPAGLSGIAASVAPTSFLDRAVNDVLLPLSLAALAAVALPGVGGLLVISALGDRQAKAGWAVHVAGIGRFAGPGPLGVVRSGSLVSLHTPRGMRVRSAAPGDGVVRFLDRGDRAA